MPENTRKIYTMFVFWGYSGGYLKGYFFSGISHVVPWVFFCFFAFRGLSYPVAGRGVVNTIAGSPYRAPNPEAWCMPFFPDPWCDRFAVVSKGHVVHHSVFCLLCDVEGRATDLRRRGATVVV